MPKLFNFDYITKEDKKRHNLKRLEIPDQPYRILIIGGSASGKANTLLNLKIMDQILVKVIC